MPATPITDPASGESLLGTEPQLQQQIDPGWWRQRLNLFTGRALTVSALQSEQNYRGGLLATFGQGVTSGTVTGLALTMDLGGADPVFTVTPGYGITASGQDVALNTTMRTALSTLTVIDPTTGSDLYTFHQSVGDPTNSTYAGILLLQPVVAQVSGQVLDTGGEQTIVSGNLGASCMQDPAEYVFEDWQIADAVRLVYVPWPAGVPALPLPPMNPVETWRNRLAYAVFEAEALLGPDDQLPWAMAGLPIALIAFNPGGAWTANTAYSAGQFITDPNGNLQMVQTAGTSGATPPTSWSRTLGGVTTDGGMTWENDGYAWKPLFVDCSAVVRAGGLPRNRYVLPAQPPPLQQWVSMTAFSQGAFIIDPNNNVQLAQTTGSSGGPPPQWQAAYGKTTVDGTVTWINNGPASWQPNTAFATGQFIFDSNGNQQNVLVAGTSGPAAPDWNGIYLPTIDGSVTWINNGTGNPPVVQPSLALARINQFSEQLSQLMIAQPQIGNLADYFPTMPPSAIVPAAALNFTNQTAPWFPANWSVSAAPVFLEELESVLETGMLMDPIDAATAAPENTALLEPVEVLVPLPDAVYDPNILVVDTVPQDFYQAVNQATTARDLTLKQLNTVQQEINCLLAVVGPNVPVTPNVIDPDAGLTANELQARNMPPPYMPASTETFGTVLQSTWQPTSSYSANQFIIDSNGAIQIAQSTGTSSASAPDWNMNIGQTSPDGVTWVTRGNAQWQASTASSAGQLILDANGNVQQVQVGGTSFTSQPAWSTSEWATTVENPVTWQSHGNTPWQPNTAYSLNQLIVDVSGNIEVVTTAGTSAASMPSWNGVGQTTADSGVVWTNLGRTSWQPNTAYSIGNTIIDAAGNIQTVTTGGMSASSAPAWNSTTGATTQDGLTWINLGNAKWQANTSYAATSPVPNTTSTVPTLIVDANGWIQQVQTAGTSGAVTPAWNDTLGATTPDASITWLNNGPLAWQPNTTYVIGQFVVDPQGYMQQVTTAGSSASSPPMWLEPENPGETRTDGGVTWQAAGKNYWQPNSAFAAGQLILDANGNIEIVQTAGTSDEKVPAWDPNLGQPTEDGTVVWNNLGSATWQPNTGYTAGQAIIDSTGSIQVVSAITGSGSTASSPPNWLQPESVGQVTPDGILWQSGGSALWQPDTLYFTGQLVLDAIGNIQIVQSGGISGDSVPAWNPIAGQTTSDGSAVWNNLGHSTWQPNTAYFSGQGILDSNGDIQIASSGGTSGPVQPGWKEGANTLTPDISVEWTNRGLLTWQSATAYPAGQIIIDSNGNLQYSTIVSSAGIVQPGGTTGQSGNSAPPWSTTPGGATTDNNIAWQYLAYVSTDLLQLQSVAAAAPYTTTFSDSSGVQHTVTLLSQSDLNNLATNGLQALISSLNARISQANDLLDTAFLTAQTDIYRFRQNILGTSGATALATSPVLANIATGETASATAENLQNYIGNILPSTAAPTTMTTSTTTGGSGGTPPTTTTTTTTLPPVYKPPVFVPVKDPVILAYKPVLKPVDLQVFIKPQSVRSRAIKAALANIGRIGITGVETFTPPVSRTGLPSIGRIGITFPIDTGSGQSTIQQGLSGVSGATSAFTAPMLGASRLNLIGGLTAALGPTQIVAPGQNATATSTDITNQSPLAGAQLNIRTLTIAERLQQSPSQEALFYAISNRLNFLQALASLETDLNLVADDLPILMDDLPPNPPSIPAAVPVMARTFSEYLGAGNATIVSQIQTPYLVNDASEATLFSVGVRVVEQHTMLLRALEARVQQYADFVNLCTGALGNIQNDLQQAQSYTSQLSNNLTQERQNVAFTSALLSDEIQQVQSTNAQRQQVLASSVHLIAYTRARTLEATVTAPSRQLVPANVASPVPACLQQSVAIPPELREIVGQLREAPLNWLPSASAQVSNLERPALLQELAINTQVRASQTLQMAPLPSSATGDSGVYASTIANIYSANQQVFRSFVAQRAALQPAALSSLSWTGQVAGLQGVAAVNDLISSESVHTEVSNAVTRLIQQVSSVAACLYTRVSIASPANRLAWAQYLTGSGLSVQLQSLAILTGWNQLDYTDRQQMQMLVDWLFLQIDTTNAAAVGFMSDVVRTAILLASDVPVDNIIPASIIARTLPVVGGPVSLSLPSDRIASGMYVNLYSGATLAARGVVSDLDNSTVTATVTDVFSPGTYLESSDTAHFTTLVPQAIALRPLFS